MLEIGCSGVTPQNTNGPARCLFRHSKIVKAGALNGTVCGNLILGLHPRDWHGPYLGVPVDFGPTHAPDLVRPAGGKGHHLQRQRRHGVNLSELGNESGHILPLERGVVPLLLLRPLRRELLVALAGKWIGSGAPFVRDGVVDHRPDAVPDAASGDERAFVPVWLDHRDHIGGGDLVHRPSGDAHAVNYEALFPRVGRRGAPTPFLRHPLFRRIGFGLTAWPRSVGGFGLLRFFGILRGGALRLSGSTPAFNCSMCSSRRSRRLGESDPVRIARPHLSFPPAKCVPKQPPSAAAVLVWGNPKDRPPPSLIQPDQVRSGLEGPELLRWFCHNASIVCGCVSPHFGSDFTGAI